MTMTPKKQAKGTSKAQRNANIRRVFLTKIKKNQINILDKENRSKVAQVIEAESSIGDTKVKAIAEAIWNRRAANNLFENLRYDKNLKLKDVIKKDAFWETIQKEDTRRKKDRTKQPKIDIWDGEQ